MEDRVIPPGTSPGVPVETVVDAQPPMVGVATSIAGFIGRTPRGPVDQPVTLLSLADYERTFGGLDADSSVSYQARGFFSNGGTQAEVVRLYRTPTVTVTATLDSLEQPGKFSLTFASLVSGQTVEVSAEVGSPGKAPTPEQVYKEIVGALEINPALAGVVSSVTSSSASLDFDLACPSTVSGGGGEWTFETKYGKGNPVSMPTGSASIQFVEGVTYALVNLPAGSDSAPTTAVVAFSPTGGDRFSVTYENTSKAQVPKEKLATALYQSIMQSPQARQLVSVAEPTDEYLTFTYVSPANVSINESGTGLLEPEDDPKEKATLTLSAANPGEWGNLITASVDHIGLTKDAVRTQGLFNLTVTYHGKGSATSERFTAVTLAGNGANRLDKVLADQSVLVRLTDTALLDLPPPAAGSWGRGDGGIASAPLDVSDYTGDPASRTGLYAFDQNARAFNILSIPPDDTTKPDGGDTDVAVYQEAAQICVDNNAMLIIDPPSKWYDDFTQGNIEALEPSDLGNYTVPQARACAVYFPRVVIADPLRNGLPRTVVPSGYVAAVWASTDTAVGVWKAPAGLDAPIGGIIELQAKLDDAQNGVINPKGINALRFYTVGGDVVWGARTLRGADGLADQYKYIPVQRLRDYISGSLDENTRWAVFQPNGAALWARLTTEISVFMTGLFQQGAFAGRSASQAFFVNCNSTTTTAADQAAGIVNAQVGFAPIYPAEFVVITISQTTDASA